MGALHKNSLQRKEHTVLTTACERPPHQLSRKLMKDGTDEDDDDQQQQQGGEGGVDRFGMSVRQCPWATI